MAKGKIGVCHICGQHGPLTFEHVPPRAAFNDKTVYSLSGEDAMRYVPGVSAPGKQMQRGAGDYTLCGQCNSRTGDWYANDFAQFCYQGSDVLVRSGDNPRLIYLHYVYPLRVIKQIVAMMFSVNGPEFQASHPALVKFVLNREARYLSPKYRFFVYFTTIGTNRAVGTVGWLNVVKGTGSVFSEISFPPFGYIMTLDSPPPDGRVVEITHFARYDYAEMEVAPLHLPVLPTHLSFPGDYRTQEQIAAETDQNIAFMRARERDGVFVPGDAV